MIKAEVLHPSRLTAADRHQWRAWCAAEPVFQNPLLGPDFTCAVGDLRSDARVALISEDGDRVGYLPFHAHGVALARPIGSPFSDYNALITAPGRRVDGQRALEAAGIPAMRFNALIDPNRCFPAIHGDGEGFIIRLEDGGAPAYLDGLREADPKRFKNWRRLTNKLEREVGPVEMIGPDYDQAAYDLLMRWKRDQLHRTGLHDFMGPAWTSTLMQSLFEQREGPMQGLMVTLRAGGRVIAGHFGVRANGHYHSWIASMDPDGCAWSPGQSLLFHAIPAMTALGLKTYDLAGGHAHYKTPFCTSRMPIGEGTVTAATAAGRLQGCAEQAWRIAGRANSAATRFRRRLDHINAVELSAAGRLRGVLEAVAAQGRRGRTEGYEA